MSVPCVWNADRSAGRRSKGLAVLKTAAHASGAGMPGIAVAAGFDRAAERAAGAAGRVLRIRREVLAAGAELLRIGRSVDVFEEVALLELRGGKCAGVVADGFRRGLLAAAAEEQREPAAGRKRHQRAARCLRHDFLPVPG